MWLLTNVVMRFDFVFNLEIITKTEHFVNVDCALTKNE